MEENKEQSANTTEAAQPEKRSQGEAFKILEALPCWQECANMLDNGVHATAVARFIQDEKKFCQDFSFSNLKKTIQRWVQKNGKRFAHSQAPTVFNNLADTVDVNYDVLKGIQTLTTVQLERVMLDYNHEKTIGKALNQTNASIRAATDLFKLWAAVNGSIRGPGKTPDEQIKNALNGVQTDSAERVKQAYEQRFGKVPAKVLMNDKDRAAVVQALQLIRSQAETQEPPAEDSPKEKTE